MAGQLRTGAMASDTPRDPIHAALLERANAPDKLFLLKPEEALSFIDAGKAAGYSLVGFDGFRPEAGSYQPVLEFSRWCAQSGGARKGFETEARSLIDSPGGDELMFEVWLEPESPNHQHG
jgi:hypothetical protein